MKEIDTAPYDMKGKEKTQQISAQADVHEKQMGNKSPRPADPVVNFSGTAPVQDGGICGGIGKNCRRKKQQNDQSKNRFYDPAENIIGRSDI
jgi:hypothetical protein